MTKFLQMDFDLVVSVFNQGDDSIACLNKAMAFLTTIASSRFPSTNNQLRTSSNPRNQSTIQDGMVTVQQVQGRQGQSYVGTGYKDPGILDGQAVKTTTAAFQNEDLDAYDSDCDVFNAKVVLMANLSNYGSYVISEVPHFEPYHTDMDNQSVHAITREKMIDSQMDDMIKEKLTLKQQINLLEQNLSNQIKETKSLLQTFTVFKNESKEKESKYMDKEIDLEKKIKKLDNIVYKVGQSTQTVHIVISSQHAASPVINYEETLILKEVTEVQTVFNQMEAAVQQYSLDKHEFCVKCLDLDAELLNKENVYNDLSKSYSQLDKHCISLELTMQLNQEIFQKDTYIDNQTALQILEYFENNDLKAQLQAKDTTICKLKEHIKSMRENDKEEKVKQDMDEIETINIELEHSETQKPKIKVYSRRPKQVKSVGCPDCSLISGLWMLKTYDKEPLSAYEPRQSKDEAPDAIIKCIKNIQVHLNATVRNVRTYNGTEFVNQTLREFYENVGITHQTSVARTPQ
ncbi:integrase, catalytic region, zinc finger, CCHC-type containing protein [Tanacetum coccineum]|uniref:Integrase, catalytic region, zinc finger, CCHC-type containing protein n=1 Tax=Tanacetum coccineum TaxID=301880 RepID=A0ABQ4YTZ2_9ASTR